MPYMRLMVRCGLCLTDSTLTFGNPQMATRPEDSPFIQRSDGVVLFKCENQKCNGTFCIPLRVPEETYIREEGKTIIKQRDGKTVTFYDDDDLQ